jgi:hypothetical protein
MKKYLVLIFVFSPLLLWAQEDDLLDDVDSEIEPKEYVIGTFKATRMVNGHTVETAGKRTLDFRINHRFGDINGGPGELFGLDGPGSIELAFDYSYDGRFQFGLARTNVEKLFIGYIKYQLFRQTEDNSMPVTVTPLAKMEMIGLEKPVSGIYDNFANRLTYTYELLIARKFSKSFSLQIAPVFSHFNLVEKNTDDNDNFGILSSARLKLTKRTALTGEYMYRLNNMDDVSLGGDSRYHNSVGLGLDIETGGHVFQVFVTNSFSTSESRAWFENAYDPTKGEWRLGFNVSRVFSL